MKELSVRYRVMLLLVLLFSVGLPPAVIHAQEQLPAKAAWTSTGSGTKTVTDITYGVSFSYDINSSSVWNGQNWEFSTTAPAAADIAYNWHYLGIHAWFHASAVLTAFVEHNGSRSTWTLFNQTVFGDFDGTGTSVFHVQTGDKYGFLVTGENYDSNSFLRGTVEVQTAPRIQAAVTGTQGSGGWYTSDVGVAWTLTDPASGAITSSGCEVVTLQTDTSPAGVTYSCTASAAGGSADQSVTIKRDATPPATTDDAPQGPASSDVVVYLSADDSGSGVAATYYKVDGGAQQTGSTIHLTSNGTHTLTYWSVDAAGNVETHHTATVTLNKDVPAAPSITSDNENPTNQNVTLTVSFPGGTIARQTSFDQSTWQAYTGPLTISDNRTVYARYQDGQGDWSDTAVYEVENIDKEAPEAPVFTLSTTAPTREVTVTIDYPDDAVGRQYQLWGDNPSVYTGPFVLTGNRTISAYATDAAGNRSETTVGVTNIDYTPPTVFVVLNDDAPATNDTNLSLVFDDEGTGAKEMRFSDDNALWSNWEPYAASKTYAVSSGDGDKTVYMQFRDEFFNESSVISKTIALDTVPPVMTIASYDGTTPTHQDITVHASVNEGTLNAAEHTFTENGTFEFSATDAAGNVAAVSVTIANIDKTPPVTTDQLTTDNTTKYVTLDVIAGDAGSGVAASYYTLDGVQYTGSHILLNKQGTHLVTYWSVDAAGNVEAPHSREVRVDILQLDALGQFHIADILNLMNHGTLQQQDLNGDNVFDRLDIQIMLETITPAFAQ